MVFSEEIKKLRQRLFMSQTAFAEEFHKEDDLCLQKVRLLKKKRGD